MGKVNFRQADIVCVNLATGHEASLHSVVQLMLLAAVKGQALEFMTMLSESEFLLFREIVLALSYVKSDHGITVKTGRSYDSCCEQLSRRVGDPRVLLEELQAGINREGSDLIFSVTKPEDSEVPRRGAPHDFVFDKGVIARLHAADADAYEEALKISEHLRRADTTGLILIRKVCERLVNRLCDKRGVQVPARASLADKVHALCEQQQQLRELDKHFLTMFRLMGNTAVHDSGVPDASLLPDKEIAFYMFRIFENTLKHVLIKL